MSRNLIIDHGDDIQHLDEENLPLLLVDNHQHPFAWSGNQHTEENIAAVIAPSDSYYFIQCHDKQQSVYINNEKLDQSQWLKSGDIIQINHRLHFLWTVKTDVASLKLLDDYQAPTAPPVRPSYPQETSLARVNVNNTTGGKTRNYAWLFATMAMAILAGISMILIFSLPMTIMINPNADKIHLKGVIPTLKISRRWLALPGSYQLSASKAGYYPLETEIDLQHGNSGDFSFDLKEIPGKIYIQTAPAVDHEVFIDDQPLPILDGAVHLNKGKYRLTVVTQRYLPETLEVEVEGLGKTQQLAFALQPAWADITITSMPSHAKININGNYVAHSPWQTTLVQGEHEIGLELDGYQSKKVTASINAGESRVFTVGLSPLAATLDLRSNPDNAEIYINEKLIGNTPLEIKLPADTKTQIEIRKSGYQSQLITKTLASTKSEQAIVKLKRNPQAQLKQLENSTALPVKAAISIANQNSNTPLGNKMILIDANTNFTMGASRREPGRRANEKIHTVSLTRAFYLSSKEITNAQFRNYQPQHNSGSANGSSLNNDKQPVVKVSWEQAARFCNWLSRESGLPEFYLEKNGKLQASSDINTGYRLPTEAEWAYAARAHQRSGLLKYPWSGNFPPPTIVGNFADSQIADAIADTLQGYNDGYRVSAPVGSFKSDKNGLLDIAGNVSEWVHDYYSIGGNVRTKTATNPLGPSNGTHHVIRGASWRHGNITELRLSFRDYSAKSRSDLGFRIARYAK